MAIAKKLLKNARCMYVYPDGHAVIVNERKTKVGATVESVTIVEKAFRVRAKKYIPSRTGSEWDDTEGCLNSRIIVSNPRAWIHMFNAATSIEYHVPSLYGGSAKTKEAGIKTSGICFWTEDSYASMSFHDNQYSQITCQETPEEAKVSDLFDKAYWGTMPIEDVIRVKEEVPA